MTGIGYFRPTSRMIGRPDDFLALMKSEGVVLDGAVLMPHLNLTPTVNLRHHRCLAQLFQTSFIWSLSMLKPQSNACRLTRRRDVAQRW